MWLRVSDPRQDGWPSVCKAIKDDGWMDVSLDAQRRRVHCGSEWIDLQSVTRARLCSSHVMRWSSDEIVEDFNADLEFLAGDQLVLGLRPSLHNRETFVCACSGFETLVRQWGLPLEKKHREKDKT